DWRPLLPRNRSSVDGYAREADAPGLTGKVDAGRLARYVAVVVGADGRTAGCTPGVSRVGPGDPRRAVGSDRDTEVVKQDSILAPIELRRREPAKDPGRADIAEIHMMVRDTALGEGVRAVEGLCHVDIPDGAARSGRRLVERADALHVRCVIEDHVDRAVLTGGQPGHVMGTAIGVDPDRLAEADRTAGLRRSFLDIDVVLGVGLRWIAPRERDVDIAGIVDRQRIEELGQVLAGV